MLLYPTLSYTARIGTLDPSFSTDGLVSADGVGSSYDQGRAVAIQEDGSIVVVGTSGFSKSLDIGVARFLADGSFDPSFSGDGVAQAAPGSIDDHGTCAVLQADGKIVVGGYSFCTEGNCFALVRYLSNGTWDTDLWTDGLVTTDFTGTTDRAKAVTMLSDGRIVVVGETNAGPQDYNFALAPYLNDGSCSIVEAAEVGPLLRALTPVSNAALITFSSPMAGVVSVDLYDLHGTLAQHLLGARATVEGSHTMMLMIHPDLSNGPYLLVLRGQHRQGTSKLVVQQ